MAISKDVKVLCDASASDFILNFLPNSVVSEIRKISKSIQDLDEYELRNLVSITPTEEKLRLSLWLEYGRAVKKQSSMILEHIYGTVCTNHTFFNIIKNPHKLSFILKPPPDIELERHSLRMSAITRLREVMDVPLITVTRENGKTKKQVNLSHAKLVLEIIKLLDDRLEGQAVQRQESLGYLLRGDGTPTIENDADIKKQIEEYKSKLLETSIEEAEVVK